MTASIIFGGIAALLVGFAKTGVPGLGILIIPFMSIVFPDAKQGAGRGIGSRVVMSFSRSDARRDEEIDIFLSSRSSNAADDWLQP